MLVTWNTHHHIEDDPWVNYGTSPDDLDQNVKGETTHFDTGSTSFYVHRALLTGLEPNTEYCK